MNPLLDANNDLEFLTSDAPGFLLVKTASFLSVFNQLF